MSEHKRSLTAGFLSSVLVGALGGLIGLGGAEFRLPLLIGIFGFSALEAVILNKATSLIVVGSALAFRSREIPFTAIVEHAQIVLTLLSGSLCGAWFGADLATRLKTHVLYRAIAFLLFCIALVLVTAHDPVSQAALPPGTWQIAAGILAGFCIGVVASFLGVAGGELLIPTLVLLFGVDIKLAGSLSLAVSLPTMIVGFVRYSQDRSFSVVAKHRRFLVAMGLGSVAGTFVGALLLGVVPSAILLPTLAAILVISAIKIWRQR
jgi:uncharacterized membrane protein YfcA